MPSMSWTTNVDKTATATSFTLKNVLFHINVFLITSTDTVNNYIEGSWYGVAKYNNVTKTTVPCIGMQEAKIRILKMLSDIEGITPPIGDFNDDFNNDFSI